MIVVQDVQDLNLATSISNREVYITRLLDLKE